MADLRKSCQWHTSTYIRSPSPGRPWSGASEWAEPPIRLSIGGPLRLVVYGLLRPVGSIHLARAFDLFQIECCAALAMGATIMADQIHRVLISLSDTNLQLANEDTKKALQLREVAHRVANNFASLDALIRQRAMASKDPKIQFAFKQASELVHVVARLNNRLNIAAGDSTLDSYVFVSDLCEDLKACARKGIAIECRAERHDVALTAAVPLGLIINELVTNSLKYAFPTNDRDRSASSSRGKRISITC